MIRSLCGDYADIARPVSFGHIRQQERGAGITESVCLCRKLPPSSQADIEDR